MGPSETADAARCLGLINLLDRIQVYWGLRTVLVSRPEDIHAFDELFGAFWPPTTPVTADSPEKDLEAPGGVSPKFRPCAPNIFSEGAEGGDTPPTGALHAGASPLEAVSRRAPKFEEREPERMSRIAAEILAQLPSRPGRRMRRHNHRGVVDLRATFRRSLAHGGEIVTLARRFRAPRKARLVVLLDVSGSMDRHTEMLSQLV